MATLNDKVLTEILLYHFIGSEIFSSAIADGQSYVATASTTGPNNAALSILIERSLDGVRINNTSIVTAVDIDASNRVIPVADQVIMSLDIVGHAVVNSNLTSLVDALGAAEGDLVNVLSSDGPFTVFAL